MHYTAGETACHAPAWFASLIYSLVLRANAMVSSSNAVRACTAVAGGNRVPAGLHAHMHLGANL